MKNDSDGKFEISKVDETVASVSQGIDVLKKKAEALEVKDEQSQVKAITLIKEINECIKTVEEHRTYFSIPLNTILKTINQKFNGIKVKLSEIASLAKDKMAAYHEELEKIRRKKEEQYQKKIQKAIEEEKPVPIQTSISVPKTVKTGEGTATFVEVWEPEITDKKLLINYLVKEGLYDYLSIGMAALLDFAKFVKDSKEIPGLRITKSVRPRIR